MKKSETRIGEKSFTNEGYEVTIVAYRKAIDIDVQIKDGILIKGTAYNYFKNGSIRNPYHKSVYGVGYLGEGKYYSRTEGKLLKCYDTWHSLLRRSYWKGYHASEQSYKDVTVCEEWHNFQNFAQWFEESYKPHMEGWHLDKDILQTGNKIYSPETCVFVPQEINKFFIKKKIKDNGLPLGVQVNHYSYKAEVGVGDKQKRIKSFPSIAEAFSFFKFEKESYAKRLAIKWENILDYRVCQVLMNYNVEIAN